MFGAIKPKVHRIARKEYIYIYISNIRFANFNIKISNWGKKGCTVRLWTILKLSVQLIDWTCGMNSLLLECNENYCQSSNQCIQMLEHVFQLMVLIRNFSQITLVLYKGRSFNRFCSHYMLMTVKWSLLIIIVIL